MVKCNKYKKFKNTAISYIFNKTLVLPIIWSNCDSNDDNIFKEEEYIDIFKILGVINNEWVKLSRTSKSMFNGKILLDYANILL